MTLIAYDHHAFSLQPAGGVSRYFCELAARIARIPGMQTHVVAPLHYNQHLRAASELRQFGRYLRLMHPAMWRLYRGGNGLVTPAVLAALRPDLLHTTYYWGVPGRASRPVVLTVFDMIHELYPDSFPANDPTRRAKQSSVQRADHIVAISHSTARDLMRLLGVDSSKITVTHLGFADTLAAVPQRAAPAGRPYLLYVGQRHGYKNFSAMLRAWGDSAVLRADFDILAFGGGPFTPAEMASIAAIEPRSGAVRQEGGSDIQLAHAYREARAFIYPSAYEGFGIPPLEAMSMRCPVACSNSSSLPEVVGNAAHTFDPSDRGALRHAMERIALDEGLRSELIERGTARVQHFTWHRCAQETEAVYRRVISGSTLS